MTPETKLFAAETVDKIITTLDRGLQPYNIDLAFTEAVHLLHRACHISRPHRDEAVMLALDIVNQIHMDNACSIEDIWREWLNSPAPTKS